MSKIIRAFPYYGGKAKFVKQITSCIPAHYTSWYELFIGGGSVTFNRRKAACCTKELINDYDGTIANFYMVLKGEKGSQLIEELVSRGIDEGIFEEASNYVYYHSEFLGNFKLALSTYIEIAGSFSAMRKNYARGRRESTYIRAIQNNLHQIRERLLSGIEVKNEDALDILREIKDDENAMVYLDPPYLMELRNGEGYRCEMYGLEQLRMLGILQKCKCRVLLSGYRNEYGENLYDSYLIPYGYRVYRLCEVIKSCQSGAEKSKGIEYIWCNYDLPETALIDGEVIVKNICA